MAIRHEVNFACPDTDDPAVHHAPIGAWDVAQATAIAEALTVDCYGFKFSTWDDATLLSASKFYVFGLTAKSENELRESADPKEQALADAANKDGLKRILVRDGLQLCIAPGAEFLPKLKDKAKP